jgi:CDP-glucose 4,6-dehydratase
MDRGYTSVMDYELGHRIRKLSGPVMLTGHTGFKGTWMTLLLEHLGIEVVGFSLPPEKGSLYERSKRLGAIPEALADIRDQAILKDFIDYHKPSTIIHMAAQPLVLKSYNTPRDTFDVNVMGSVNLLDIAVAKEFVKAIVVVTTDKVYRNNDDGEAFCEIDPLEGKDPYSASKVATEAVVKSWQRISELMAGPKIVSVRSGNVIGGGDYSEDRIIPDIVRGLVEGNVIEIRNPLSTRPWQHVLDPLHGYLKALEHAVQGGDLVSVNFGPTVKSNLTVKEVSDIFIDQFPHEWRSKIEFKVVNLENREYLEARHLSLNSEKAASKLLWENKWSPADSVIRTSRWWRKVLDGKMESSQAIRDDIDDFFNK